MEVLKQNDLMATQGGILRAIANALILRAVIAIGRHLIIKIR